MPQSSKGQYFRSLEAVVCSKSQAESAEVHFERTVSHPATELFRMIIAKAEFEGPVIIELISGGGLQVESPEDGTSHAACTVALNDGGRAVIDLLEE